MNDQAKALVKKIVSDLEINIAEAEMWLDTNNDIEFIVALNGVCLESVGIKDNRLTGHHTLTSLPFDAKSFEYSVASRIAKNTKDGAGTCFRVRLKSDCVSEYFYQSKQLLETLLAEGY